MGMRFTESHRGMALVLLAGASWGVIGIPVRALSAMGFGPLDITAMRSAFTGLLLMIAVYVMNPKALKVRLRDLWCMAGCGLASITLFNICYFATLQRTSIGIAVILLYTSPIFVTVLSHFCFKEPFRKTTLIALAFVTAGCVLVSGVLNSADGNGLSLPVLLTGLGAGL